MVSSFGKRIANCRPAKEIAVNVYTYYEKKDIEGSGWRAAVENTLEKKAVMSPIAALWQMKKSGPIMPTRET